MVAPVSPALAGARAGPTSRGTRSGPSGPYTRMPPVVWYPTAGWDGAPVADGPRLATKPVIPPATTSTAAISAAVRRRFEWRAGRRGVAGREGRGGLLLWPLGTVCSRKA